jgi:PhnB protein
VEYKDVVFKMKGAFIMVVTVYINFNGNCREAVQFYAEVFKTEKPEIMTFAEMPPDPDFTVPEEAKDLILHTSININGSTVMFSDILPGTRLISGNNISLTVMTASVEETEKLFNQLKEGGTVDMELQETFYSKRYGSLTDKYGIMWQIMVDDEQM